MSTNINEVNSTTTTQETTNEFKKPKDIYLITVHNQCIVHEATGPKTYNKLYYTPFDTYKSGDTARRVKNVKLPLNRESTIFGNVYELWDHLKKNCGYMQL